MTVEQLVQEFLVYLVTRNRSGHTVEGYRKDLRIFAAFLEREFGVTLVEDVEEVHIEAYIQYLGQVRGLQPRSQNRYVTSIRSMYHFAVKKRLIKNNVLQYVENVQYERRERDYLTEEELYRLFDAIHHPIAKVGVLMLAYTGLRISELLNLRLTDIDLHNGVIKVLGKGSKERIVPLSTRLQEILLIYLKDIRPELGQYVFATKKTGRLSPQYLNKIIREGAAACGFHKRVSAHTLRHSFASHLVKKQVDLPTLQRLLGHANIRTTSIYLHTDYEMLKNAVNRW